MTSTSCELIHTEVRNAFARGITRPLDWRLRQIGALSKLLKECEDQITKALKDDLGKSPFESFVTEIAPLLNSCDMMMKNIATWMKPQKVSLPLVALPASGSIVAEPFGAVLIISPWTYPILMSLDPLIGAIGAGNAAVLMPSIVTHSSFTVLNELIPKYLDKNAIKVVGCETRVTEEMLNLQWDKIFFTGSPRIAKFVMQKAAEHLTPVTLELGGKCPTIVDSSTDMEVAARRIAAGKWGVNCGQSLIAPDYVIVEKGFAPVLLKALKNALRSFFGSHPSPENPDLMRLVNEEHFRRVKAFLEDPSVSRTIKHGGGYDIEKRYIEPTILLDPPRNAKIMREEILGPILPIITVERIDEAIDFINTKEKPLALYLFTENDYLKNEVINKTSAGTMLINDTVIHVTMQELPFGGVGKSGMGAHHGKFSFEAFSHMKPVMVRSMAGDVDARYPPYTPEKRNILRRIARFQYLPLLLVWLGLTK